VGVDVELGEAGRRWRARIVVSRNSEWGDSAAAEGVKGSALEVQGSPEEVRSGRNTEGGSDERALEILPRN